MEPTEWSESSNTPFVPVTSSDDERLTDYRSLVSPRARRRFEAEAGLYVAEGVPLVTRLLQRNHPARSVLATPQALPHLRHLAGSSHAVCLVADPDLISSVVGFDFRRGVIGSFQRPPVQSAPDVIAVSETLALIEGVNDPENLGAILRAAAALAIDGVLLNPTTTDPYYRRCIRVSMGAAVEIPNAVARPWPGVFRTLSEAGFTVVALTTNRRAPNIDEGLPSGRAAVVLGAEGSGLRPETIAAADLEVTIPMTDRVDSLNVGQAAAIAFHTLNRQKRSS